jgi:hypothetical protein
MGRTALLLCRKSPQPMGCLVGMMTTMTTIHSSGKVSSWARAVISGATSTESLHRTVIKSRGWQKAALRQRRHELLVSPYPRISFMVDSRVFVIWIGVAMIPRRRYLPAHFFRLLIPVEYLLRFGIDHAEPWIRLARVALLSRRRRRRCCSCCRRGRLR